MEGTKPRLGKGLDALLGEAAKAGPGATVPVDKIQPNPYQPRKRFDEDELHRLRDSIKEHGVLQPLAVRKAGDGYQLIAGERRLRAAQLAGLTAVPVHVVAFDDRQVFEAALVENVQRTDLNPIEKAAGFKDYLDRYSQTQDQLGARLGLDRSTVSNLLGLLHLAPAVQDAVRLGQISPGHAKALRGIHDPDRQAALCKEVTLKGLSVHALEQLVKAEKNGGEPAEKAAEKAAPKPAHKTPHVEGIENDLRQRLACRVEIKVKAKEKGQIVIGFDSNDEFERVVSMLNR